MTPGRSIVPTIAVDLGGTKISAAIVEGPVVRHRMVSDTRGHEGVDAVVRRITDVIGAVTASGADAGPCMEDAPLAVAATGRVAGGRVHAVNDATMPGWADVPLRDLLGTATGRDTVVVNDAHAAAWGEYLFGAGQGTHGCAFVTWSTGIGGGLVIDGRPWVGVHGLAGHVGFVREPTLEAASNDAPVFVPVERLAGGRALDRAAFDLDGGELGHPGDARSLLNRASKGDVRARAVLDRAVERVSRAVAALQLIADVEVVVVGGGVGLAPGMIDRLRDALESDPLTPEGIVPTLRPASLGVDAGLVGAAAWPRPPA